MKNFDDKILKDLINSYQEQDVFDIVIKEETESTNIDVRKMAQNGAKEGTVIVADAQTGGKGTRGRSFSSPKGTGLYMSMLLRPEFSTRETLNITCIASIAVCRAIEKISGKRVGIKWVNDIYSEDNKKLCGILTEAVFNEENSAIKYAVLGIGINVYEPENGFDAKIKDIAGALFESAEINENVKEKLAFYVLSEFWDMYKNFDKTLVLNEYRKRSVLLGKRIYVLSEKNAKTAVATEINEDFSLSVRYADGREEALISGDVSIKKL